MLYCALLIASDLALALAELFKLKIWNFSFVCPILGVHIVAPVELRRPCFVVMHTMRGQGSVTAAMFGHWLPRELQVKATFLLLTNQASKSIKQRCQLQKGVAEECSTPSTPFLAKWKTYMLQVPYVILNNLNCKVQSC